MSKFSVFEKFYIQLGITTIEGIADNIRSGKYKDQIEMLRNLKTQGDKNGCDQIKSSLLAFTPSGVFSNGRSSEKLITYSNIIHLDYDHLPVEKLSSVITKIKSNSFVLMCFISPSGDGIKLFIKVDTTAEEHTEIYKDVSRYFDEFIGHPSDKQCKDISRLCFFSWDPNLYLNLESEVYQKNDADLIERLKNNMSKEQKYSEGNRNNFIFQLAIRCNQAGILKSEFLKYCTSEFNDLSDLEIRNTVNSSYSGRYDENIGTQGFSGIYAAHEKFLKDRYDFKYNEVTGNIEFKNKNDTNFKRMNDYDFKTFKRSLDQNGLKCSNQVLETILFSDFSRRYNPFKNFLKDLPKWDGYDRIGDLSSTVQCKDQKYFELCFKRWMIAMVGSMWDENVVNQHMIVFAGDQGIGKTRWFQSIIPEELKGYTYFGLINPQDKDTMIHLSECFLIVMDELEALSKHRLGYLKEVITKPVMNIRRPYGRTSDIMPRVASLAASVNNLQFITDETGTRRFLVNEVVGEITVDHQIDLKQGFAQALHLFLNGEKYWFDLAEIVQINVMNQQYELNTPEEELLLINFEPGSESDFEMGWSATEIIQYLIEDMNVAINLNSISMGRALNKHGFIRKKVNNRYVYLLSKVG